MIQQKEIKIENIGNLVPSKNILYQILIMTILLWKMSITIAIK